MGCSCCSNEINNDNSYFANFHKKRKSKLFVNPNNDNNHINNNTSHLRIDNIGSVNSINFNGVLNITYKNDKNDKNTNKRDTTNKILTDLSENYISRRATNNNINNSKITNNNESIIGEIKKTNYNIITIKKKESKNNEVVQRKNSNKISRQEQMLNLLALFIKGKTGLINYYKDKKSIGNEILLSKGLSPNSLDNLIINTVNSNLKKNRKIFKNQKIPTNNTENFIDDLFPPNKDSILGLKNGTPVEKIEERLKKSQRGFIFDIEI